MIRCFIFLYCHAIPMHLLRDYLLKNTYYLTVILNGHVLPSNAQASVCESYLKSIGARDYRK